VSAATRSVLVAAAVVLGALAWPGPAAAPGRPARAPVARPAAPAVAPAPPPTARDVLAAGVALDAAQRRELEGLAREWERASATLEAAVRAARDEFDRFAATARAGGRTSLAELQQRSAELRELSAELRARRQAQSDAALAVLTDDERRAIPTTAGGRR
jgi:hypothetical protein